MSKQGKAAFFESMRSQGLALTFDDVRLRTSASEYGASEVSLETRFSRNIPLKIPFVSAAMDTVTTSTMAIALAKEGGIGVIHAGLNPEDQKKAVQKAKFHLNGLIDHPITVTQDRTLASILKEFGEKDFDFRTIPVVDGGNKLVGILNNNDFLFATDKSKTAAEAMKPLDVITHAPASTSIEDAYKLMKDAKRKMLPLLNDDGSLAGLYIFSDVHRLMRGDDASFNLDSQGRLRVAAAVPTDEEALTRLEMMHEYVDAVVIDTAQGDSKYAFQTLKDIKSQYPKVDVVIGNVSEASSAKKLAEAGADAVKVGQGPGSICTTRVETGIGTPQVTAVYECARAVEGMDVPVIADGGIRERGDIAIALAAGASSVMMGSKLAGTREAPGRIMILENGSRVKLYRGMGSASALKDSAASRKRYGDSANSQPLPEGVEAHVPFKGSVIDVIQTDVKAVRKSLSYVGAANIDEHRENTEFWRITNSGLTESRPHDVAVI